MNYDENTGQPKRWSFSPQDSYRPFKRKKREQEPSWTAPEHGKVSRHMERAYPIAHDGRKMVELGREIVLERRPEILIPKRTPIFLGLDQPCA